MIPQLGPGYLHEPTTRFSVYSIAVPETLSVRRNEARNVSSGGGKEKSKAKKEGSKASNGEKTKQKKRNDASKTSPVHVPSSLTGNADSNPIGSNLTVSLSENGEDLDAMRAAVTKTGAKVRQMKKVMVLIIKSPVQEKIYIMNGPSMHQKGYMSHKLLNDTSSLQDGVQGEELQAAIAELKGVKAKLAKAEDQASGGRPAFNQKLFDDTLVRRMFVVPSFEIHGGVRGLYDLGPAACGLKAHLLELWRKHFVLQENMLEVWC